MMAKHTTDNNMLEIIIINHIIIIITTVMRGSTYVLSRSNSGSAKANDSTFKNSLVLYLNNSRSIG